MVPKGHGTSERTKQEPGTLGCALFWPMRLIRPVLCFIFHLQQEACRKFLLFFLFVFPFLGLLLFSLEMIKSLPVARFANSQKRKCLISLVNNLRETRISSVSVFIVWPPWSLQKSEGSDALRCVCSDFMVVFLWKILG